MLTLSLSPHTVEHWPQFTSGDGVASREAPTTAGRGPSPQRDDGWVPFIAILDRWLSSPDSIPMDEGWERPSDELLRHASLFAKDMHLEGWRRPSVLSPIPDGGVSFQLHSENYGKGSGDWYTIAFDMYNDGTADSSFSRSTGESDFVTVRLGFGHSQ